MKRNPYNMHAQLTAEQIARIAATRGITNGNGKPLTKGAIQMILQRAERKIRHALADDALTLETLGEQ